MIDIERKIYIIGDIDHDAYLRFTRKLTRLESESSKRVHVVLCSDGGDASVALAFHDRIKMSSAEITICATGLVASAAVLILVAAKKRSMTSSAWCMVHDDTVVDMDGKRVCQAKKAILHAVRVENQWNELMAKATGLDVPFWDSYHKKETFFDASECCSLGIVQEIV